MQVSNKVDYEAHCWGILTQQARGTVDDGGYRTSGIAAIAVVVGVTRRASRKTAATTSEDSIVIGLLSGKIPRCR